MKIMSIKKMFKPQLTEHIPGRKRVYKNIFGKTVSTIERSEKNIENLKIGKISEFMRNLHQAGVVDTNSICVMDSLTATQKPINIVSFIVKDGSKNLNRANAYLKSGQAAVTYKSTFINGDISSSCRVKG